MGGRDLETIRDSLREHVNALAVDIGPRTPLNDNSLVRAANYIHSVFEDAGLSVTEQAYQILCPVPLLERIARRRGLLPTTLSALTTTLSRGHGAQMIMRVRSR